MGYEMICVSLFTAGMASAAPSFPAFDGKDGAGLMTNSGKIMPAKRSIEYVLSFFNFIAET
jgi:hypothetical protein